MLPHPIKPTVTRLDGVGVAACARTTPAGTIHGAAPAAVRVTLCIGIGDGCDTERADVGRHVEAVGEQRHRMEGEARDNFADHHRCGQRHDPQGPPGIFVMAGAEKHMVVGQRLDIVIERHGGQPYFA